MKASINSITYQLRICRQNTINLSPFEAHFGRKANTSLNKISTEPDPNHLTYKPVLNKYLDMETLRWDELILDEKWDDETRSYVEIKKQRHKISKDAKKCYNEDPDKESRTISHPDAGLPVPRTEASLTLKLAKKKPKSKRFRKCLNGLYEVLAPGSSVVKSKAQTLLLEKPGKIEVTVRISNLPKFGTKANKQTDLKCYIERRPKMPTGKTIKELTNRHAKDAKQKNEGDKKIKNKRINDDTSCVSCIHSNVSRALRVRMPNKPKKTVVPAPPKPPSETTTDFALPMMFRQTSIVIPER